MQKADPLYFPASSQFLPEVFREDACKDKALEVSGYGGVSGTVKSLQTNDSCRIHLDIGKVGYPRKITGDGIKT